MRSRLSASLKAEFKGPEQAPGVIQTNLMDASNIVWFVTAEKLPAGTLLSPYIVLPDGSEILMDALSLTEDVPAGTSFDLPNIRKFGAFWQQGLLTYGMVVTRDGYDSQASADFPVASARNYEEVSRMVPRISLTQEGIDDRDVILWIDGEFTSAPAYVLVEDLVVPGDAIHVTTKGLTVNLSRVPGLDLGIMREYLVTVGQSGWCDTVVFRHLPARPGSYNKAPE